MSVGGKEYDELTGAEVVGCHVRRGGVEDDVLFRVVGLGHLRERGQRRPKHGLASGPDELDVNVLAVGLELGLADRLGGVALHQGETVVAVKVVTSGRLAGRQFFQKLEGGGKPRG